MPRNRQNADILVDCVSMFKIKFSYLYIKLMLLNF